MKVLRPHLAEIDFLGKVRRQEKQGYQLAACIDRNEVCALAGFRVGEFMAWGKVLYLDDLITDPEKKKNGYGGSLMKWIQDVAEKCGCDEIHLDTGYGRNDAHRLYLKNGFLLASHHLSKNLNT